MPVDADMYMAGAMPGLSRGGSWLPDATPALTQSHRSALQPPSHTSTPTPPHSPLLQTPPAGGHMVFQPSNAWANSFFFQNTGGTPPWSGSVQGLSPPFSAHLPFGAKTARSVKHAPTVSSELAEASTTHGLKREHVLGPVKHGGWLKTTSQATQAGSIASSGDAQSYTSRPRIVKSYASEALSRKTRPLHPFFDQDLPPEQGRSWGAQGGAPKPLTPEPEYEASRKAFIHGSPKSLPQTQHSSPYRRVAEVLPSPPSHASSKEQANSHLLKQPKHRHSPHHEGGSHIDDKQRPSRPVLERRHSHEPRILSPKPKKASEGDLSRSAQLNSRLARLSLEGRRHHTPDSQASSHSLSSPLNSDLRDSHSAHSRKRSGRPNLARRHTSDVYTSTLGADVPPPHKVVEGLKRNRYVSHPAPASPSASYSERPPVHASLDSTASRRTRALSTPSSPVGPKTPISERPPAAQTTFYTSTARALGKMRTNIDEPPGYVSPVIDDAYDRYTAHPAAPAPDKKDRSLRSSQPGSSINADSHDPQRLSNTSSTVEYLPLGYARPTRDLAWNRTGPAMKTHGIAWLREEEAGVLPDSPRGPRWEVARPPRAAPLQGGSWWESGGEGSAV